jgi:hypothetical protein
MAIIRDEQFHVIDHKNTGDSGTKNTGKGSNAGGRSSGHNPKGSPSGGGSNKTSDRDRTKSGNQMLSESSGTRKQAKGASSLF